MADRGGAPFEVVSAGPAPRIEGKQGQAWAKVTRTHTQLEYMVHPRLLALAERAGSERPYREGERYTLGEPDKVDKAAPVSVVQNRDVPKLTRSGAAVRARLSAADRSQA